MSDIGELVNAAVLDSAVEKCPFKIDPLDVDDPEDENILDDDTTAVQILQDNDGGKLGRNLESGSAGSAGTWNAVGGDPPEYKVKRVDTRRTLKPNKTRVLVPNDTQPRPFTVAAHHLVPGNAALYDSDLFKKYMKKGAKVKVKVRSGAEKTFELNAHIGYCVNGSHNGVWLPGSYAIRSGASPNRMTWSVLNDPTDAKNMVDWCKSYMASVAKVAGGQFHDTHEEYSDKVLEAIDLLATRLSVHQGGCKDCENSDNKVPPPYGIVKPRLYKASAYLRSKVLAGLRSWKRPWFTSDQVMSDVWSSPNGKKAFRDAYNKARTDVR